MVVMAVKMWRRKQGILKRGLTDGVGGDGVKIKMAVCFLVGGQARPPQSRRGL